MQRTKNEESAVLVLSPNAQDAELAVRVLQDANIPARVCRDLGDLTSQLTEQTNGLLIAEEALVPEQFSLLLDELGRQPPWSDIPLVILTAPGQGDRASVQAL